jgi:hypothetical protein
VGKRVVTKPDEPETIVVSYSELDAFRQCPLKHYLGYTKRWTAPKPPESPLYKGTFWHDVMEVHYRAIQKARKQGKSEAAVEAAAEKAGRRAIRERERLATTDEEREVVDLITWMYEGYLAKYQADPQWDILGVETRLEATLGPFPEMVPEGTVAPRFRLKAKLDIVVFDHEAPGLWVVDHKSGANLPNQMDLEIDDQFGLYQALLLKKGHKTLGSIHSAARTTRNAGDRPENQDENGEPIKKSNKKQTLDDRMRRTYLNRGAAELQSIEFDAWATAMSAHASPLPVYSAPDPRSCGWKCDFKEQHLIMRTGRPEDEVMTEYGFVQDFTRH